MAAVLTQESFDRAVALTYDAALDPSRMPAAVAAAAEATGAVGGLLGIFDLCTHEGHAPWLAGLDPGLLELFERQYVCNPWSEAMRMHATVGRPESSELRVDAAELRASAFHAAILAPQDLVAQSFYMLRRDGRFTVGLPLMYTVPGRSADPEVLRIHALLGRHMARAFELMRQLDTLRTRLDTCETALDRNRCAVFVLDGRASIRFVNARGRRLLSEGDGLFSVGTWLTARHNGDGTRLAACIAAAASKRHGSESDRVTSMPVRRGPDRLPLVALTMPGSETRRLSEAPHDGVGEVLLFVADPSERGGVAADLLRDAFGLTDREASVALTAIRLGSVPAVAAELGIAVTTARTHLQHVFDKTGSRNQVALAQMLAALDVLPASGASA
jgi:DNA-binding CsgD family transcriptional regulator/PAS domain-containing protein